MKMNKTIILATICASLFASCGKSTGSTAPESDIKQPEVSSDKPVTLTYGIWDMAQESTLKELAAKFTTENPNIKVEIKVTPWKEYWTSLQTSVTANSAPDVFWMNIPRSTDFIQNGILAPLNDLNIDQSNFPETHIKAYTSNDQLFGIPKDFDDIALVYNKTLFDEAGIAYPDENWKWADLRAAAEKLTNKEKDIYGIIAPPEWQENYYNIIYQNGSTPFTENGKSNFADPKVIEAIEFWRSFTKDGLSPDLATLQNSRANQLMISGRAAMNFDGSWNVALYEGDEYGKANLDYAALPKQERSATMSNSLANVVFAKGKNVDAAKKFVAFLSSKESNEYVAKESTVIPAYNGTQEEWISRYPGKNVRIFVDSISYAIHLPTVPNFNAADSIANEYLVKVWSGELSVKEACEKIAAEADAVLPGY